MLLSCTDDSFFLRNSCFLFMFLLIVDGLMFFFFSTTTLVVAVFLVSREKEKLKVEVGGWRCIKRTLAFIQGGSLNWLHQNLAISRIKLDTPNFSMCQNLKLDTPNFS